MSIKDKGTPQDGAEEEAITGDLRRVVAQISEWQEGFGPFEPHPSVVVDPERLRATLDELTDRLAGNYPFFHPTYAGQMLKPPHPVAVVGYLATMLINPNNHALDGGPPTAALEREVVAQLAAMFGYDEHLGHLTSSGTIANLEALFVAREINPGGAVAYSADAHYTHQRMCHLLGLGTHVVPTDAAGRMDLDALVGLLDANEIRTVVVTAGTTGLGAIDPVHEVVALAKRYGFRVHVDAAYGGFFSLIADDSPEGVAASPFAAIRECDSIVVDPHKHGLQPYGCGAVLFKDPAVGRFYKHESPYTYFTSQELHLGEISLECSRAGAAAAALWATLQCFPLTADGLGSVLRAGRRAALNWHALMAESELLEVYQPPELDILTYYPRSSRLSEIDALAAHVLNAGMTESPEHALYVATYGTAAEDLQKRGHAVDCDVSSGRILRSVLMKPESEEWVYELNRRVERLVASGRARSE